MRGGGPQEPQQEGAVDGAAVQQPSFGCCRQARSWCGSQAGRDAACCPHRAREALPHSGPGLESHQPPGATAAVEPSGAMPAPPLMLCDTAAQPWNAARPCKNTLSRLATVRPSLDCVGMFTGWLLVRHQGENNEPNSSSPVRVWAGSRRARLCCRCKKTVCRKEGQVTAGGAKLNNTSVVGVEKNQQVLYSKSARSAAKQELMAAVPAGRGQASTQVHLLPDSEGKQPWRGTEMEQDQLARARTARFKPRARRRGASSLLQRGAAPPSGPHNKAGSAAARRCLAVHPSACTLPAP